MSGVDVLQGERLRLRAIESEDASVKAQWLNDPETRYTLHYSYPIAKTATREWCRELYKRRDHVEMIVETVPDSQPIGYCGLKSIDMRSRKAEAYIAIGEAGFRGQGYGREAWSVLLGYAFFELGLRRVYLYTWVENTALIRMAESLGFRREGVLRGDVFAQGEFRDRVVMGVFSNEVRAEI